MNKLYFILIAIVVLQGSQAIDLIGALNVNLRGQLEAYERFLSTLNEHQHKDDLKKLIQLTEDALKLNDFEEKEKAITSMPTHFNQEFNEWISKKLEEAQVDGDIENAMAFYNSLLTEHNSYEDDIKKTLSILEEIHRVADLKDKVERFINLSKDFSDSFDKFLKESSLPNVNTRLQKTIEFFANVLKDESVPFKKEILELKAKCEKALNSDKSLEDKQKVLHEVTYTDNQELNDFLQKKNLEYD
ncbi:uncharacterized protein LOC119641076 [Glossina fuscipes]|uniref:Uncharacterized protein LOC119641076 n=1 Tax=Glossina fuscipes TaxID=7396 RepID=A0A9C5ZB55_9MUSC|nr:uncharacterized protein LOC119641076 [Glossina fuscipes]KAI9577975.1 hypothetical protein GQX74_014119 [Glossina fuscipes]